MLIWQTLHIILGIILTVAWLVCMMDWVRRGCPIPRPVHILALLLLAGGIGVAIYARMAYGIVAGTALLWIAIPPAWAYVGWLLCLGPWGGDDENGEME
jgi:hypothetical protein